MVAVSDMVDYSVEGGVAVLTINNPPVNALSHGVRVGLQAGVQKAQTDDAVSAILLHCEGRTFFAGADISEFATGMADPMLHDVLREMDESGKPIVAAIHGTALGGGLETALCCHYRVAVDDAKFGLPEVNLGLLPGGGGTQRLPRVVGVEKALDMITTGKPIGAGEALQHGLIDAIIGSDLRGEALAFAREQGAKGECPRVRDDDSKLQSARENPGIFDTVTRSAAPDYVFYSLVVHSPKEGRGITALYLQGAAAVLLAGSFNYRNEIISKSSACLECLTEIDGLEVNGADLIHWNHAGLITKFKALTRRLKAVNLVHQKLGETLASLHNTLPETTGA